MYMEFKLQDFEKKRHLFTLIWLQGWKYSKTLMHIYKTYPIISQSGGQVTSLIWQKTSLFDPHTTPGGKRKFRILTAHLRDMRNHFIEYHLSTSENVDILQVTNFTGIKKYRFFDAIWHLGISNDNFETLLHISWHSQSYPRVSFVYSMKYRQKTSEKKLHQKRQFLALNWFLGQKENYKTLLRICKACPIRS